ncbi:MAG: hypothetical protein QW260_06190 [Thermoproteota archaeon]
MAFYFLALYPLGDADEWEDPIPGLIYVPPATLSRLREYAEEVAAAAYNAADEAGLSVQGILLRYPSSRSLDFFWTALPEGPEAVGLDEDTADEALDDLVSVRVVGGVEEARAASYMQRMVALNPTYVVVGPAGFSLLDLREGWESGDILFPEEE